MSPLEKKPGPGQAPAGYVRILRCQPRDSDLLSGHERFLPKSSIPAALKSDIYGITLRRLQVSPPVPVRQTPLPESALNPNQVRVHSILNLHIVLFRLALSTSLYTCPRFLSTTMIVIF